MTWQEKLSASERRKLDAARNRRDKFADEYKALRLKLKSKADALIRAEKAKTPPPSKQ